MIASLAVGAFFLGWAGPVAPEPVEDGSRDYAAVPVRDTVVEISREERIAIRDLHGDVFVDTWERAAVRVAPGSEERTRIEVMRTGGELRITVRDRKDRASTGELRLTVPPWVAVEIRGREGDVDVEGVTGGISVRTLDGPVRLRRVGGGVRVRSVHGGVSLDGVEGPVEVRNVEGDVGVTDARGGEIFVETVDGDVILDGVDAGRVAAGSVDGDVSFRGPLRRDGTYHFTTHDGDVTASVTGSVDARVSISTFDGRFESDFPVVLERFRGGEVIRFTLGEGGAELHLEAFDGEIRLERGR